MPRIKPPPARNAAPLAERQDFTPPTEEIEIELAEDGGGPADVDLSAPPPAEPDPQPEPAPAARVVAPEPAEPDNPLQRALDSQKRAEELQAAAQRERDAAMRRTAEVEREREQERADREDAEYNSVLTSIAAEQSSLEKAESDYAAFAAAGDWTSAAKAQRSMATASSRIDRLEDNKRVFDSRREEIKRNPPPDQRPSPQPAPHDFESRLASIPGLPDNAKDWLRKHPEFVNDTTANGRIGAAHNYLVNVKSVAAFSPAYFDALDQEFGFKTAAPPAAASDPEPQPQPAPQQRTMPMRAPVSRDVPSASGQRAPSSRITLTPEERQIARTSFTAPDMTDAQKEYLYAQNKAKLAKQRANGSYPQSERN